VKQEEFEEYINELQNKEFITNRRPSLIVNNFYSLITIVIISIAILIYTNYVVPAQHNKTLKNAKKNINY